MERAKKKKLFQALKRGFKVESQVGISNDEEDNHSSDSELTPQTFVNVPFYTNFNDGITTIAPKPLSS